MTKPVNLPSKSFRTQSEAKDYFTKLLNSYELGSTLSTEDSVLIFELLQRHPEAEEKIGVGVRSFFINHAPDHPTRCFYIRRLDGSTTEFAIGSCITSNPPTQEQEFYKACRESVRPYLDEEKLARISEAGGRVTCCVTGEEVSSDQCEYRHTEPKFKNIVEEFVKLDKLDLKNVALSTGGDMQSTTGFVDETLRDRFIAFHAKRARLDFFRKYMR
jgi:hypothetical protein